VHEAVDGLTGHSDRVLMSVAAQAHEEWILVTQPDATSERVDLDPRLNRLVDGLGDRDLTLAAALPAHEQPIVPRVGPRAAQILGA
jgi:hypothetical protein